jgi:hypothetical protein
VPAIAPELEAGALATAIRRPADTDVIKVTEAKAVNFEAAAADVATDFAKGVKADSPARTNLEDANAVAIRRSNQADRTVGLSGRRGRAVAGRLFSAVFSCGL